MQLAGRLDQVIELSNRVDVRVVECLDGEVAGNGEDNDRVEVVRQEPSRVRAVFLSSRTGGSSSVTVQKKKKKELTLP